MQLQIAPSLLAADFMHLADEVEMLNASADLIHLDVMDGSLVPNLSFGFSVIEPLARMASIPCDVHLMIVHPEKYFQRFVDAGADYLSFHLEAARKARRSPAKMLRDIKAMGAKAGLAINPDMPVEEVFPYLEDADFILVMSVFAGFGGQKFIEATYDRVRTLKAEINRRGLNTLIEIDGGVGASNAAKLGECGATMLVAGSSVFKSADPAATIAALRGE
ncbi:MAG: ribulose-phosphate 3-epimerase [Bacteroidales bacterium]|nr:ribulose-phosphate 3-epimerase [Candidatus Cryptobacteroides onthequi]